MRVDDSTIQFCQQLKKKDFITKTEDMSRKRKGKREYLNNHLTRDLMKQLNRFFESNIDVPRMKVGKKQTMDTLINEEAFILAKFLRNERKKWKPRVECTKLR